MDSLDAVSPLDGRYANRTEPLRRFASEGALLRARTRVEIEYLIALADLSAVSLSLDQTDRTQLRSIYRDFDQADARLIKRIETTGTERYPATNHDVKAVEYFIRERLPEHLDADHWIHFGLTSEDVNNLAYRLLIRDAVTEIVRPALETIRGELAVMADRHRAVPMLARTHGQPATPTTFGKEIAVYAKRLEAGLSRLDRAHDGLAGKLAGATGTYAAHHIAYPDVDWRTFARDFVTGLGLEFQPVVTQVNPGDDLAHLFDTIRGLNHVLVDFSRDAWLYVSQGYLVQDTDGDETGSSTMPHKVNPIDFENAEGNLTKATSDLTYLGETITTSRLQRDLSDSTVKRNMGAALAHCLLGYTKLADGIDAVRPDPDRMRADLEAHPEVLAEAVQTILRRQGDPEAYERMKELTRDREMTVSELRDFVRGLDLDPELEERLLKLDQASYTGLAALLVEELADSGTG